MKLKDQVAIITGASKGIGKGVAAVFAQEGAKVVLAANGLKDGEQAAAEIQSSGGDALFVQCDVSNE